MPLRPLLPTLPRLRPLNDSRRLSPLVSHNPVKSFLHPPSSSTTVPCTRSSSSASSARWLTRQRSDPHATSAHVSTLKSRAAYKLLEIHHTHRLFARGDVVVDLGYAPGSWSQVAVSKVGKEGRVVGVDVIPAHVRGVSTLQGDFLSEAIREEVRSFVGEVMRARRQRNGVGGGGGDGKVEEADVGVLARAAAGTTMEEGGPGEERTVGESEEGVNVVLSDMSAPWPLDSGRSARSVSNPHRRMMNTSGTPFRDHAGSMDLCTAALSFAADTLAPGGHFLCKFYQGAEDRDFEMQLQKMFEKVKRIKPDASRKESREAYFLALRRRKTDETDG